MECPWAGHHRQAPENDSLAMSDLVGFGVIGALDRITCPTCVRADSPTESQCLPPSSGWLLWVFNEAQFLKVGPTHKNPIKGIRPLTTILNAR